MMRAPITQAICVDVMEIHHHLFIQSLLKNRKINLLLLKLNFLYCIA